MKRTLSWRMILAAAGLASMALAGGARVAHATPGWYYLGGLDGTEFNSQATYEAAFNYNYPWGDSHNGGARMKGYLPYNGINTAGELDFEAVRLSTPDGTSQKGNTINYWSGTSTAKSQIEVTTTHPNWIIKGDFQVPEAFGCWPAFWLTGVNAWPPEIDQMEYIYPDQANTLRQNIADGPNWHHVNWWSAFTPVPDAYTAWHNYEVHLDLAGSGATVTFYLDGVMKGQHSVSSGFVNAPFWLILDLQMEGSSGSPGPSTNTYYRAKNVTVQYYSTV